MSTATPELLADMMKYGVIKLPKAAKDRRYRVSVIIEELDE